MNKTILALGLAASFFCASAQVLNPSHLQSVKQNIDKPFYSKALSHLISEADSLLKCEPMSVMDKEAVPASGDRHDYAS